MPAKSKFNSIETLISLEFMPAKSKLNSIETLISQELIDSEISHKECKIIFDENLKYEKIKENVRMIKSQKIDAKKDELKEDEGEKIESNKIIRENNRNRVFSF